MFKNLNKLLTKLDLIEEDEPVVKKRAKYNKSRKLSAAIPQKLKYLRTQRKCMSLRKLGKEIGVSYSYLSAIERGKSSISELILEKLNKYFGVDLNSDFKMPFLEDKVLPLIMHPKYDRELDESIEIEKGQKLVWNGKFVANYISPDLSTDDLKDLPAELLTQLTGAKKEYPNIVIDIIEACGGVLSRDKLLVEYYKKTDIILKKETLRLRMDRLRCKGVVFTHKAVPTYYSTKPITEDVITAIKLGRKS